MDRKSSLNLLHNLKLILTKVKNLCFQQNEYILIALSRKLKSRIFLNDCLVNYFNKKIDDFNKKLIDDICSDLLNAFWHWKKYDISLPYIKDFSEKKYFN